MPDPPFDSLRPHERTQILLEKIMDRGEYIRVWGEQQLEALCTAITAGEEELAKIYSILASIEQNMMAYHSLVAVSGRSIRNSERESAN